MFTFVALAVMSVSQLRAAPALVWQKADRDPFVVHLVRPAYCDDINCHPMWLIGGYDYVSRVYRDYIPETNSWTANPRAIPLAAPKLPPPPANLPPDTKPAIPVKPLPPRMPPTGVVYDSVQQALQLPVNGSGYSIGGVQLTADEAAAMLTDDSGLPFLTIIAAKEQWRSILDSLPARVKTGSRLKCMPPEYWAAKKFNVPVGSTGVFYTEADGKKIAVQSPFTDGAPFRDTAEPPLALPLPVKEPSSLGSWILAALAVSLVFLGVRN